jgi:WXG100 family type VII secretion target
VSSPGYLNDAQAMTRAITGFAECAANAKTTMTNLENDLTQSLSSYAGDQATSFWALHTQLQDKMRQVNNELDTMSNLVTSATRNYNTGDSTVAQSFKQVAGSIDAGGAVLGRLTGA